MTAKYDPAEAERLIAEARRCKWCKGTGRSGPGGCFECLYCEGSKAQPSAMADQLEAARARIRRLETELARAAGVTRAHGENAYADDFMRVAQDREDFDAEVSNK